MKNVDPSTDPGDITSIQPVVVDATLRTEVDMQVATAKRYPRDIKQAINRAKSSALLSEEIAASCCYSVPRAGKQIRGASVRLAEIMVSSFGNMRCEKRAVSVERDYAVAEGVCWDLETNQATRVTKKRRIVDRNGKRFSDDMIQNTLNACASIAFRDAVFIVIPKSFVDDVYRAAEELAVGNVQSLAERRGRALEYFHRFGVTQENILASMGKKSIDELTLDDVAGLRALAEEVRSGNKTLEQAFPDPAKPDPEAEAVPDTTIGAAVAAVSRAAQSLGAPTPSEAADKEAKLKGLRERSARTTKPSQTSEAPPASGTAAATTPGGEMLIQHR